MPTPSTTMTEESQWFEFDGREPILAGFNFVTMAGYAVEPDGDIVAWSEEIHNPDRPVMFLISCKILRTKRTGTRPNFFITDGDKWHPLIRCVGRKYRSYSTGFTGPRFTSSDRSMIIERIQHYIKSIVDE